MNILDEFADDVTQINISKKNIEGSLDFARFTKLIKLDCYSNKITSLDNLVSEITKGTETFSKEKGIPNSLIELKCDDTIKDYDILINNKN
jgi:hypothetical protein